MIEFYCERIEENVDRKDCEICDRFKDCKRDGYLSGIDTKFGIDSAFTPEQKQLETVRKMLQRALKPGYLKDLKKDAYSWKISGGTDPQRAEFTEQDFQTICEVLGKVCNSDLRDRLMSAANGYLSTKEIWKSKPTSPEVINELMKIMGPAKKLLTHLDKFDSLVTLEGPNNKIHLNTLDAEVYSILKSACEDIDSIHIGLHRFKNAIEEVFENLQSNKGALANFPLILFLKELKNIFEDVTGQKATVSYKPVISKSNDSSKSSPFFQFALACIQCVDPEAY